MAYYYPAEQKLYKRRSRRLDWVVGIVLGVVIGVAVVAAFLFFGSEDTIDAPSISGVDTGKPAQQAQPIQPTPAEGAPPAGE